MNTRRKARLCSIQLLYQEELNPSEKLEHAFEMFWEKEGNNKMVRTFAERLVKDVLQCKNELDARLNIYAENWDIPRMNAVDRNVIRLALFELFYRPDIPPVVSINEAVDLAKLFGSEESGRFVNGILDRALKDIDRPLRSAASKKKKYESNR